MSWMRVSRSPESPTSSGRTCGSEAAHIVVAARESARVRRSMVDRLYIAGASRRKSPGRPGSRLVQIHSRLAPGETLRGLCGGLTPRTFAHVRGPAGQTDQQLVAARMSLAQIPLVKYDS